MSKIQFAILAVAVFMLSLVAYVATVAVAMLLMGVGAEAALASIVGMLAGIFVGNSSTMQDAVVSVSEKLVKTSVSWGSKFKTFVREKKEAYETAQFNKAQGLIRL